MDFTHKARRVIPLQRIKAAQVRAERNPAVDGVDALDGVDGVAEIDAVVVLGARVLPDRPTLELKARLDHACRLWRLQPARKLMVSGGGIGLEDEVRVMTRYLLRQGIPAPSILACQPGNTTWQSLCSLSRLKQRYGMRRFIIVSSGYHAARIQWITQRLKLQATVSAPPSTPETSDPATLRSQRWREWFAWQWLRCVVAVRAGIARVNGQQPAWAEAATDRAAATAANPPGRG